MNGSSALSDILSSVPRLIPETPQCPEGWHNPQGQLRRQAMKTFDPKEVFPEDRIQDFLVDPVPRYIEKRGWIYIILDSVYPDHLKIGRTSDLGKRLTNYNTLKPFPTASVLCISGPYPDVILVETKILDYLYTNTRPTTFKKEWFEIQHKKLCITTIEEAERVFLS